MRCVCVVEAIRSITDVASHRTSSNAAGTVTLKQRVALTVNRHTVPAIGVGKQNKASGASCAYSVPDRLSRVELSAKGRLALLTLAIIVEVRQALNTES